MTTPGTPGSRGAATSCFHPDPTGHRLLSPLPGLAERFETQRMKGARRRAVGAAGAFPPPETPSPGTTLAGTPGAGAGGWTETPK